MMQIFVVGSVRTGTTLLQCLLSCSSRIETFTESHLFEHFRRSGDGYRISDQLPARVRDFFLENGAEPPARCPPSGWFSEEVAVQHAVRCIEMLDELARSRGKDSWVEKTPLHLRQIPLLERAAHNASFVHIVRAPKDVLASARLATQAWRKDHESEADWRALAHRLAFDLAVTVARANQDIVVDYDLLVENPSGVIGEIYRRLGLHADEFDMSLREEVAQKVVRSDEAWKERVLEPVRRMERPAVSAAAAAASLFRIPELYAAAQSVAVLARPEN